MFLGWGWWTTQTCQLNFNSEFAWLELNFAEILQLRCSQLNSDCVALALSPTVNNVCQIPSIIGSCHGPCVSYYARILIIFIKRALHSTRISSSCYLQMSYSSLRRNSMIRRLSNIEPRQYMKINRLEFELYGSPSFGFCILHWLCLGFR